MTPAHISTVPHYPGADRYSAPTYEQDGLCHCDPQPASSPIGQCPRCLRLDARKAMA